MYWDNFATGNPKCPRIKVGEHQPKDLFSLNGLRRYFGIWAHRAARRLTTRGFLSVTLALRKFTRSMWIPPDMLWLFPEPEGSLASLEGVLLCYLGECRAHVCLKLFCLRHERGVGRRPIAFQCH